jgi:hypothetical protein
MQTQLKLSGFNQGSAQQQASTQNKTLKLALGFAVLMILVLSVLLIASKFKPANVTQLTEVSTNDIGQNIDTNAPKTVPVSINSINHNLPAKPFPMSAEEKASRENILKALLDISSATQLGVNYNNYGEILRKALSTIDFEKTKLSAERHERYLDCADNAMRFYKRANYEWADYFKYDFMRDENITLMTQGDFDELQQLGITVDLKGVEVQDQQFKTYRVPFDKCLGLFWKAAGIYINQMKEDNAK